ncbi:MAG: class I SAM-dependent methyltransferase [Saprospiraceae bacterium]|nr:class I SAM-dependent methyltransferase [Saprospiraceae bacterium]MCB9325660.1 class I SAM-dependent methyltransferase [Lewinellaceae bacterium]
MKKPLRYRNGIPFFYDKTATDFKKDIYERYDDMVVRQTALHLADALWGHYPIQAVLDFAEEHYQNYPEHNILEVGCGVGRWIGSLAKSFPKSKCHGIDYSYQMLKRAREFWVDGKELIIDLRSKGFSDRLKIQGHQLENLQLGLAKASDLPFAKESQDLVLSSFLLDRLENPGEGLLEMHRVLKPNGLLILITPLNFKQAEHWAAYYPPVKLVELLTKIGFAIIDWQEEIIIREPIDFRDNAVTWKCLGVIASKAK